MARKELRMRRDDRDGTAARSMWSTHGDVRAADEAEAEAKANAKANAESGVDKEHQSGRTDEDEEYS